MTENSPWQGQLILIRHAPVAEPGRLWGRGDVAAKIDTNATTRLAQTLPPVDRIVTSPAKRCRQTAEAIWPSHSRETDARLWEQDFGEHDGLPFGELPDLGTLSSADLAAYAPPGGESFASLAARVAPALTEICGTAPTIALVVHAGVIRAALGHTLGSLPAALAFEVETLSVTRLRTNQSGPVSIMGVNQR